MIEMVDSYLGRWETRGGRWENGVKMEWEVGEEGRQEGEEGEGGGRRWEGRRKKREGGGRKGGGRWERGIPCLSLINNLLIFSEIEIRICILKKKIK